MAISDPEPQMLIKDLETLKVFADPLRNQIMEILAPSPHTITQISQKLGLQTSKLYYHINLLEKFGFIRVVDKSLKGNLVEKHYWLTAYECKVEKNLYNFATPSGQETTIHSAAVPIETTRDDIIRSFQARSFALEQGAEVHPRSVVIFRELCHLTDEQADDFIKKLNALTEEYSDYKNQSPGQDTHTRALTIAFYPSFYYETAEAEQD